MEKKSNSSCCEKILRFLRLRVKRGSYPQDNYPTATTHNNDHTQMNPISSHQYSKPLKPTHIIKTSNNTNNTGTKPAPEVMIPISCENDSDQMPPRKVVSNADFAEYIKQAQTKIRKTSSVGEHHWPNDGDRKSTEVSAAGGGEADYSYGSRDQFSDFINRTRHRIKNTSSFGTASARIDSINKY